MNKKGAKAKFIVVAAFTFIALVATFAYFPVGNYDYKGFIHAISLGLDLKGGVYAVYQAADTEDIDNLDTRMNGTVKQLTQLLTSKGYSESVTVREGSRRIRVEVPDISDPGKIFEIIGEPAEIVFLLETSDDVYNETVLTGAHIEDARMGIQDGEYVVQLRLNAEGADRFGKATSENVDKSIRIDVTRGSETTTISTAKINQAITNGQAIISGDFTQESAQNLADQIMSGTFSITLDLIELSVISATLGEGALLAGLIGGGVALILIMAFMIYFYKMLGVVAAGTMLIYMVLMIMFLGVFPWVQLTLPGIAGIILSLGMMIDGNIIIYERMKDEFRQGKSILAAYYAGFKRATPAILDGNITTIIAAVMLIIFGTGTIQGFGITLLIGLVLSMFATLVVSKFLLRWALVLNNTDRKLYGLARRDDFDETKEVQYVPKTKEEKQKAEGIRLVDGKVPEGASNE